MNKNELQGYLYGILTALCWATSPIFISKGLEGISSSIWATAIGLSTATLIYLIIFLWQKKKGMIYSRPTKNILFGKLLPDLQEDWVYYPGT